jgi:hypothetical protein
VTIEAWAMKENMTTKLKNFCEPKNAIGATTEQEKTLANHISGRG